VDTVNAMTVTTVKQEASLCGHRVLVRHQRDALSVEVFETVGQPQGWTKAEGITDLFAEIVAVGWEAPPRPVHTGDGHADFMRIDFTGLRVWVDGRQVTARDAVDAFSRGVVIALEAALARPEQP
jgi:hypothetical protein